MLIGLDLLCVSEWRGPDVLKFWSLTILLRRQGRR